ncbi:mismatch-specific DNA-glycosylase [Niveispirillum sp. BGYR6]|uniref:mismatch-specific DNA-glycosylase n=1 Tax=Niveispirillum sp. BGYR6 TaxID=2971249 RepID=UPI0022B9AB45|nr:mismatch-specific DNA-glycosylase [Niveispirillum sp. BGYR6]MDG5493883.1 mismatch-specific DNA-glycosylase [Niveispirillum sp. BGYR6]
MILPDLLRPGLDLVFCGTAPSRISAARGAYYANPGNRFWPSLWEVGLLPAPLRAADFPRLNDLGLGLTDLNKTEIGNDADLSPDAYDVPGFIAKMRQYRPGGIAFTSKHGAAIFLAAIGAGRDIPWGRQPADWEGMTLFVLTSPSGQARRWFNIDPWRQAAAFVAARRGGAVLASPSMTIQQQG